VASVWPAATDAYIPVETGIRCMVLERSPNGDDTLTGQCDHCGWSTVTTGYPELVQRYQDHLRDSHPQAWLRS
jgi:hypothetical protein